MNHDDHVRLIRDGVGRDSGGVWADFGAGSGAFTLALRDLAGSDVEIIAIDRDQPALRRLSAAMNQRFPGTRLRLFAADFTAPLDLPPLDGILAANAIHFVPRQEQVALLGRWREYLKPGGRLVVVEYDAESGNRWVPYPMSYTGFAAGTQEAGFAPPALLATAPSRFLDRMYAAATHPRFTAFQTSSAGQR
jgi:ubiquinone/menaquinone biosynthesis C-methylase UbiE